MDIFTVSFFGHRIVEQPAEIEKRLCNLLRDLLREREYVEFLVGREGDFDLLASSCIRRIVREYGNGSASLILVLPYPKSEIYKNKTEYLRYYDEIELCESSANAHFKSAIRQRNNHMVDRSDLVICYIRHESGGAARAVRYAGKQEKRIINLAERDD